MEAPSSALALDLLLHHVLDVVRRENVLNLHTRNGHAPSFRVQMNLSLTKQDCTHLLKQLLVDGLSGRERIIQSDLGDNVTQRGLRITGDSRFHLSEQLNRVGQILDIESGRLGIRDTEIDEGIDVDHHIILRNDVLLSEVQNVLTHINAVGIDSHDTRRAAGHGLHVLPVHHSRRFHNRNEEVNTRLQCSLWH